MSMVAMAGAVLLSAGADMGAGAGAIGMELSIPPPIMPLLEPFFMFSDS